MYFFGRDAIKISLVGDALYLLWLQYGGCVAIDVMVLMCSTQHTHHVQEQGFDVSYNMTNTSSVHPDYWYTTTNTSGAHSWCFVHCTTHHVHVHRHQENICLGWWGWSRWRRELPLQKTSPLVSWWNTMYPPDMVWDLSTWETCGSGIIMNTNNNEQQASQERWSRKSQLLAAVVYHLLAMVAECGRYVLWSAEHPSLLSTHWYMERRITSYGRLLILPYLFTWFLICSRIKAKVNPRCWAMITIVLCICQVVSPYFSGWWKLWKRYLVCGVIILNRHHS
jgi:hypothetical protein